MLFPHVDAGFEEDDPTFISLYDCRIYGIIETL